MQYGRVYEGIQRLVGCVIIGNNAMYNSRGLKGLVIMVLRKFSKIIA